MKAKTAIRKGAHFSALALASTLLAGPLAVDALAQASYQSAPSGPFQNAASVEGLPVVYLSAKDGAEAVHAFGEAAASDLKYCDKKAFDKQIANLRWWQSHYSQIYDSEHAKAAGFREHDLGELADKADAKAEVARDDANSVASIINWLLLKQDWEHCKPPAYHYDPGPRKPKDEVLINVSNGVITGTPTGRTPEPAPSPSPAPPPQKVDPIDPFQDVDLNDIEKALDKKISGEIGMSENIHTLELAEVFNPTGVTTGVFKHTVDPVGVYGALNYHWSIPNSDFMLGASAALNLFNINNRQVFLNGTSWGTNISGYAALTGQLMYSPPSMRNVGFFIESGVAAASQTIKATFAPAFSSNSLVAGFVIGAGAKIALPSLGQIVGRPVFFTAKYDSIFLANQTTYPAGSLFHYRANSRLQTISAGLEVRF